MVPPAFELCIFCLGMRLKIKALIIFALLFVILVAPLIIVNGFSIYWYWFDSSPKARESTYSKADKRKPDSAQHPVNNRRVGSAQRKPQRHARPMSKKRKGKLRAHNILVWIFRAIMHIVLQANTLR